MVRLLLIIFAAGFVVSLGCYAGAVALGAHHPFWVGFGRGSVGFRGDGWGDRRDWDDDQSGPTVTRELVWSGGDSLRVNVPAVVHYTQGPEVKITATGPQAWVDKLVMEGDTLALNGDMHLRHRNNQNLTLTITAPSVHRFELNSAQKMDIDNYAQDDLDLQTNGAAQINAHGSARHLRLQMNGAGQANLGRLVNDDADVEINGAGQATLAATNRANIEINGFGQARLTHHPKSLKQSMHGLGNIEVDANAADDDDDGDKGQAQASPPATPAKPLPLPGAAPPARPSKPHKASAEAA